MAMLSRIPPDDKWFVDGSQSIECATPEDAKRLEEILTAQEAELARLRQELEVSKSQQFSVIENNNECLQRLGEMEADRDALAAENREMWAAIQSVLNSAGHDVVTLVESLRYAATAEQTHTAREVERVKKLEATLRMFADRPCGSCSDNSNCEIEMKSGRLERKCYSCEARDALDAVGKPT